MTKLMTLDQQSMHYNRNTRKKNISQWQTTAISSETTHKAKQRRLSV